MVPGRYHCLKKVMDGLGNASDGLSNVSDGLGKASDVHRNVLDGFGKVSDSLGRV